MFYLPGSILSALKKSTHNPTGVDTIIIFILLSGN